MPAEDFKEVDLSLFDEKQQSSYKFWTALLKEVEKGKNEFLELWKAHSV